MEKFYQSLEKMNRIQVISWMVAITATLGGLVIMSAILSTQGKRIAELEDALSDEMKIKTVSQVEWYMSNFPGSDKAKEFCRMGKQKIPLRNRHGSVIVNCMDQKQEGFMYTLRAFDLESRPSARVFVPSGYRKGPLAEPVKDPNDPKFTNYCLHKPGVICR